jgi:hypothetical protein
MQLLLTKQRKPRNKTLLLLKTFSFALHGCKLAVILLCTLTAPEDLLLCTTWLQISSYPIVHTGQRKERLWARIEKRYNEQRREFPCRLNRALSSRWEKIRADVSKFSGYYARVLREKQSGLTGDDKVSPIAHNFRNLVLTCIV